jgi:hypothetical protein
MRNLPFSQMWSDETRNGNQLVTLYTECPESWLRAKRVIALGYPVLLLPLGEALGQEISEYYFPVTDREVFIIDPKGIDHSQAKNIGITLIRAGATAIAYFGPDDQTIFFWPKEAR